MVRKMITGEFIRKNLKGYYLGFFALIVSCLLSLILPKLLGYIMDGLEYETMSFSQIQKYALLMLLLGIAIFAFKFMFRMLIIGKSRDLECFMREKLFAHLQTMPPRFYNEKKTGDLMAYAINDLGAIRMAFSMGLVFLVDGIILNVSSVIIMATTIDFYLTVIAIIPVFLSVFITLWLRKLIRERFIAVQEAFADLSDRIQENITGIRVVKAYVQEKEEISKLEKASNRRYKVQMDYVKLSALLTPIIQFNFAASFAVIIVIGGLGGAAGRITVGDFVALNTYLLMLVIPLNHLSRTVELWQKGFASMKRLDDIFVQQTDITDIKADYSITEIKGAIKFDNLTFSYPTLDSFPNKNKNVLENISFEVKSGTTLGIIGTTGSGKTTLMNILTRLYQIEDGKVFIDGNDINHIPLSVLRTSVGFVPQDNFLFATSINQNVKFFDELIKNEAVIDSSKLSCVYDNILDFPEQFETLIGERGITLSGGQKQRLSIARAVVKNPDILILDDSLSAVDTNTEEKILTNIKQILNDKTGIIIAHRVSTIRHADEIIYMHDGKIIERGTHDELLALGGEYFRLNKIQALETELKDDKTDNDDSDGKEA